MVKLPTDTEKLQKMIKTITTGIRPNHWVTDIYNNIMSLFPHQQPPKSVVQALIHIAINNYQKCIFSNKKLVDYGRKLADFVYEDGSNLREVHIFSESIDKTFLLNKIYCPQESYRIVRDQVLDKKIIIPEGHMTISENYVIERKLVKDFFMSSLDSESTPSYIDQFSNLVSSLISESYSEFKSDKYKNILNYHKVVNDKQLIYIFNKIKNKKIDNFLSDNEHSLMSIPTYNIKFTKNIFTSSSIKNIIETPESIQKQFTKTKTNSSTSKKQVISRNDLEEYISIPINSKADVLTLMEHIEKKHSLPSNVREKNKYRAMISGIIKKSIDCYFTGESIERVVLSGSQKENEFSNGDTLSFDHLFPQCLNGINSLINGMPMCAKANSKKSDLLEFESAFGTVIIKPIAAYNIGVVHDYIYMNLHKMGYSKNKSRDFVKEFSSIDLIFDKTSGNIRKKALLHYSNYYREQELKTIEKLLGKELFDTTKVIEFLDLHTPQYKFGEYRLREKTKS